MSIYCRTGCGKKVDFEYRDFSDGFSYVLYRDLDGNPHHCAEVADFQLHWYSEKMHAPITKKIRKLQKKGVRISPKFNFSEYRDLFWKNKQFHSDNIQINFDDEENIEDKTKENQRKLESIKVMCNVLPMPFFKIYDNDETANAYLLTELAEAYEELNDLENASLALAIQHEITNDQFEKIILLEEKSASKSKLEPLLSFEDFKKFSKEHDLKLKLDWGSKFKSQLDISKKVESFIDAYDDSKNSQKSDKSKLESNLVIPSVMDIREQIRTVERQLKLYLKNKYENNIPRFRRDFPDQFEDAEKMRSEEGTFASSEKNIFDYLTLGSVIHIITNYHTKKFFPDWNSHYNQFLHNIRAFRNKCDHFSGENIEDEFSNDDKMMINIFCNKVFEYLENISKK